ncbi:hypothetical protein KW796_01765 [Candidatus Parcubacteria bacterium]|nr:hypothetical protein [Candidatus Parcubacteria bacterium]
MITFLKNNMALIVVAILFIIGIYVYSSFRSPASVSTTRDISAQAVGSDVLNLYSSIQSVSLNQSLFSSPLYKRLVDFSTPIPNQLPGRNNPFDSIGRD